MRDPIAKERLATILYARLDIAAFVATALGGAAIYFALRQFDAPQWLKSVVLVGALCAYALAVWRIPRVRIRLDQAGDNAYYLGLLFTLMSMAVALYEFSVAAETGEGSSRTAAIIGNFGIALATTIAGIFLRVILHQMRVDPTDVEGMTRIELAEASKRVKAELDTISMQMSAFHSELQQRSSDVLTDLLEQGKTRISEFNERVFEATGKLVGDVEKSHAAIQPHMERSIDLVEGLADETVESINKLKGVSVPPLRMANRLEKVTTKLEALEGSLQNLVQMVEGTSASTQSSVDAISAAARILHDSENRLQANNAESMKRIQESADLIATTVARVSETMNKEATSLERLEQQHRDYATAVLDAEKASEGVLRALTEAARGLTKVVEDARRG